MVAPSQPSTFWRWPTTMAWWAMVSVRPELSRMMVLTSGRPNGLKVPNSPPRSAGPSSGQPVM